MKQLTCEMCGSTELIKQNGVFVCQTCGTKYSVEEAKKMMIEGTVEVTGSVKVDTSDKIKNLYVMARRAKDENNAIEAAKYYEMIIMEVPNDWEALFYFNFFNAQKTNLHDLSSSVYRLNKALNGVFEALENSGKSNEEKWNIAEKIINNINGVCIVWTAQSKSYYNRYPNSNTSVSDLCNRVNAIADLQKNMADLLEQYFIDRSKKAVLTYLKLYVENYLLLDTLNADYIQITLKYHLNELTEAENRIKAVDPDYKSLIDEINKEKSNSEDQQKSNGTIQINYQLGHYDTSNQWYFCPNSVGGNTVRYAIKNTSTKTIKYYILSFVPYNAVGDPVSCNVKHRSIAQVKGTGPIAPNCIGNEGCFENAWYSTSINKVKLVKAEIEYMDGTKEVFDEAQILPIAKSNANIQNNAQPTPTGAAKVFFILCGISPVIGLILGFCSLQISGPTSDTLLLLMLFMLFALPIIFAIIGRIIYNSTNKK